MGIAALVIGIIAVLLSFVPCLGFITIALAVIGFILGVVDVSAKSKAKQSSGCGTAGVVLNSAAFVISIVFCIMCCTGVWTKHHHLAGFHCKMLGPCPVRAHINSHCMMEKK